MVIASQISSGATLKTYRLFFQYLVCAYYAFFLWCLFAIYSPIRNVPALMCYFNSKIYKFSQTLAAIDKDEISRKRSAVCSF